MSQLKKVEGGVILQKPINSQARKVIAPRAWWAEPQPDKTPSLASLQTEITRLKDYLTEARKIAGKRETTNQKTIAMLNQKNQELTTENEALRAEKKELVATLKASQKQLQELQESIRRLL